MPYQFVVGYGGGGYLLRAYPNGNTATVIESRQRWADKADAEAARDRANAGDKSGLTFSSFADD